MSQQTSISSTSSASAEPESSSAAEEDGGSPPPPPPNTPTDSSGDGVFHHHAPTLAASTPSYSRTLAIRLVPYVDASRLNPDLIPSIAGATAGFASGIVTCPLDVIKTKLQAQGGWARTSSRKQGAPGQARYRGLVGTSRMIWQEEGLRGMYRGLGPLILGYLPTWMVYFTVYEKTKTILDPSQFVDPFRRRSAY